MVATSYKNNEDFALAIAKQAGAKRIISKERTEHNSCSIVCAYTSKSLEFAYRAIRAATSLIEEMNPACVLDVSDNYAESPLKHVNGSAESSAIAIRDTSFDDTITDNYGTEVYICTADTPALGIAVITVILESE